MGDNYFIYGLWVLLFPALIATAGALIIVCQPLFVSSCALELWTEDSKWMVHHPHRSAWSAARPLSLLRLSSPVLPDTNKLMIFDIWHFARTFTWNATCYALSLRISLWHVSIVVTRSIGNQYSFYEEWLFTASTRYALLFCTAHNFDEAHAAGTKW